MIFTNTNKETRLTREPFVLEDYKVIWRNFAGRPNKFGAAKKEFAVILDQETAEALQERGVDVKYYAGKDDYDGYHYIKINVGFKKTPPAIKLITGRKIEDLNEETCGCLDFADLESTSLSFTMSTFDNGVVVRHPLYLVSFVARMRVDPLAHLYADAGMLDDDGDAPF